MKKTKKRRKRDRPSGPPPLNSQPPADWIKAASGLRKTGRLDEAIACCQRGLAAHPNSPGIYLTLGNAFAFKGDQQGALKSYKKAIALNPNYPDAHCNLGNILKRQGDTRGAISSYRKALNLKPDHRDALNNLGIALTRRGRIDEAMECYQRAINTDPQYPEVHNNLGNALNSQGKVHEAILSFQKALILKPDNYKAWNNLGGAFRKQGKLAEAIAAFNKALEIKPYYVESLNNMAGTLLRQGEVAKAIEMYKKAVRVAPNHALSQSNLLLACNYIDEDDPERLFSQHRNWAMTQGISSNHHPRSFTGSADRKLRIGYVSPDFKIHSVAYFMEGVIECHDRSGFEIFCYSDVLSHDSATRRFAKMTDHFTNIVGMDNTRVADLIRRDNIDIVVDLAGHTAGNRMPLFAMKPAPIQVSYLGYPNTTGLETMDYRLTDNLADPPGRTDGLYTESLVRLPGSFLCYTPPAGSPEVENIADVDSEKMVFGSFNNRAKITSRVVAAWSRILKRVPSGRIMLKSGAFADAKARQILLGLFAENGVDEGQIELIGHIPSLYEHLRLYNRVHIGLDTFPYNGATTTCEALWMGVPVVALAGREHRSRVGVSILSNGGLEDLVAESEADYVQKAVQLAKDVDRLSSIKRGLREKMMRSSLMDREGFTRSLEEGYRWMFDEWMRTQDAALA